MSLRFPLIHNAFEEADRRAVIELFSQDNPRLTQGSRVQEFESRWSEWLGVKYSVFVNSGASANLLTMHALKNRVDTSRNEIVLPSFTWSSDVVSVVNAGFKPIFVDIKLSNLSMDLTSVLQNISDKTAGVFVTHAQGYPGVTKDFVEELKNLNICLIEDVCESHGAELDGSKLGSLGLMSNFSFYYAHHLSTIEGGMICTNDHDLYQQLRMMRSHGLLRESNDSDLKEKIQTERSDLNKDFIFEHYGFNVRNTEVGAVLGLSQLERLDDYVAIRNKNYRLLIDSLDSEHYFTDFDAVGISNYAFNIILRKPNNDLLSRVERALTTAGVEYRRGSVGGGNMLRQPFVKKMGIEEEPSKYPITEHVHHFGLYIGNHPRLSMTDIKELSAILNTAVST